MSDMVAHLSDGTQAMLKDRLVKGEEIAAVSRVSPAIYWQAIAVAVIGLLFMIFVAQPLAFLLWGVAGLMAIYAALRQSVLLCVVTNKRIMARSGIIKVDMVDIRFNTIESVELEQMLTGYFMGYSTLVVMGTGNRYISLPYVANGAVVRRAFNELTIGEE